jgi:hypothetical protein
MYRSLTLAVAVLSSAQVAAADMESVYVAPGGIYAPAARVFVKPGPEYGAPAYAPPGPVYGGPAYVAPRPFYGAPAYVAPRRVYGVPPYYGSPPLNGVPPYYGPPPVYGAPAYVARARTYAPYLDEAIPRPLAAVPYGGDPCVVNLGYGRYEYCD